jgi:hypothetical protein
VMNEHSMIVNYKQLRRSLTLTLYLFIRPFIYCCFIDSQATVTRVVPEFYQQAPRLGGRYLQVTGAITVTLPSDLKL